MTIHATEFWNIFVKLRHLPNLGVNILWKTSFHPPRFWTRGIKLKSFGRTGSLNKRSNPPESTSPVLDRQVTEEVLDTFHFRRLFETRTFQEHALIRADGVGPLGFQKKDRPPQLPLGKLLTKCWYNFMVPCYKINVLVCSVWNLPYIYIYPLWGPPWFARQR